MANTREPEAPPGRWQTTDADIRLRVHEVWIKQRLGRTSRAQSWEYFDASLTNIDGTWLISDFRLIPTLSDDRDVAPYPATGDPAG